MAESFKHLLSPIRVSGVLFKNRIFAAPSGLQALSDSNPWPSEQVISHYLARAESGAACVCCVGAGVVKYKPGPGNTSWDIYNPQALNRMAELSRRIHAKGAKAFMELGVAGLVREGLVVSEGVPTIWNSPGKEMSRDFLKSLANGFADAAQAMWDCGYDGVLLHFGHGMPVAQFLSPLTNKRTDEYGGSFGNRCRLAEEIIDAIREKTGKRLLIEVRISGREMEPGGLELDEALAFAKKIEDRIDLIHVSCGLHGPKWFTTTHPCGFLPPTPNIYLAEAFKKEGFKIPVVGIGGVQDLKEAEQILKDGKADILSLARGIIADEKLLLKAYEGRPEDVRPCVKCMRCHDSVVFERQFHCTVNPRVGMEAFGAPFNPKGKSLRVAVIGGGPAGMEAALEANNLGHRVTLFEQRDSLGGTIRFSDYISFKYPLKNFKDYLISQIEKSEVDVRLGLKATPEFLKKQEYDAVILAIGAKSVVPAIEGINAKNVRPVLDIFGCEDILSESVAIIGGGQAGLETALHLASSQRKVTVLEMQSSLAPDASPTHRNELLEEIKKQENIHIITGARCREINEDCVIYEDAGGALKKAFAESIVTATGSRTDYGLMDSYLSAAPLVIPIGDAVRPATVEQAIESAYITANNL